MSVFGFFNITKPRLRCRSPSRSWSLFLFFSQSIYNHQSHFQPVSFISYRCPYTTPHFRKMWLSAARRATKLEAMFSTVSTALKYNVIMPLAITKCARVNFFFFQKFSNSNRNCTARHIIRFVDLRYCELRTTRCCCYWSVDFNEM